MPHKHRRGVGDSAHEKAYFELPPTSVAGPLSAAGATPVEPGRGKRRRPHADAKDDDTPRAFARLMAFRNHRIKPRSGLDDGRVTSKKQKRAAESADATSETLPDAPAASVPKIMPGERMADYSARVDAALPVSGLINKGKSLPGVKKQQTKMEKRMQRMQHEWRIVDARRKEERAAERQRLEDEEMDATRGSMRLLLGGRKGKRRSGRVEDDPWAAVGQNRKDQAVGGLVGLHDVVQAPPRFAKPKAKFKIRNGAQVDVLDVPAAAGSLRRREELGRARRSVVDGYRQMMKARKMADAQDAPS